jgi:hypothetical protein
VDPCTAGPAQNLRTARPARAGRSGACGGAWLRSGAWTPSRAKGNHEIAQTVTEAAHPTLAKRAAPTSSSGWLRLEPTMTAPAPPISPHRSQMTAYLTPQPRANARSIDAPSSLRPEPKPGTLDPQVGPTGRRLASPISLPSWAHGREEGGWTAGATLWQ